MTTKAGTAGLDEKLNGAALRARGALNQARLTGTNPTSQGALEHTLGELLSLLAPYLAALPQAEGMIEMVDRRYTPADLDPKEYDSVKVSVGQARAVTPARMTSPLPDAETVAAKLETFVTINDSYPSDMEIQSGACFGTLTLGDLFPAATLIRSQASETASLRATIAALEAERDEARGKANDTDHDGSPILWRDRYTEVLEEYKQARVDLAEALEGKTSFADSYVAARTYGLAAVREAAALKAQVTDLESSLSTKTAEVERLREALENEREECAKVAATAELMEPSSKDEAEGFVMACRVIAAAIAIRARSTGEAV